MGRSVAIAALLFLFLSAQLPAGAQEHVRFASLDGTALDAYLVQPSGEGRHPAIVLLHGCGGLLTSRGRIESRLTDWSQRFAAAGYVVLMVDSFTSRGVRRMCAPATYRPAVYAARKLDAYAALRYLRAQPNVIPDRIGLAGWSEGGGVVLGAIAGSGGFRAAVAFYPARCNERWLELWRTSTPLLVVVGDADVWTPAAPCRAAIERAAASGSPVQLHVYAGAYHDFDWPNLPVRRLPAYRTASGVVPIAGMDPAARSDVLSRVPTFLATYLSEVVPPPAR